MYKITTLKNKLRIITHYMPSLHGVTTGIFVGAGSRYESDKLAGVSHFLEHMFFKGTSKRPTPADISKSIESIGGNANAATSQDYTFFYNQVPSKHSSIAIDVLIDMINNSLFDSQAIAREKGVILEELNMYLDTPSRYVYEILMGLVWPNSSLGRDIIGTRSSVKNLTRQDSLDYMKSVYQPHNMVLSAAGKINHQKIVKQVKQHFDKAQNGKLLKFKKVEGVQKKSRIHIHPKKTDQVHLALGLPSLPYNHKDEPTLSLLNTILGVGMSSRLFLNIREKQGLCYSIHSFQEKFEDTGLLGISAGLNIGKIEKAIIGIIKELKMFTQEKVSKEEIKNAKEFLRGNLTLQMDNTDYMATWYGLQGLFWDRIQTPQEKIKKLLQVNENDIIKLAKKLFLKDKLNLALIGPFSKKDESKFLKLLK